MTLSYLAVLVGAVVAVEGVTLMAQRLSRAKTGRFGPLYPLTMVVLLIVASAFGVLPPTVAHTADWTAAVSLAICIALPIMTLIVTVLRSIRRQRRAGTSSAGTEAPGSSV
jgi:uncharacterized membrane protein HdeD (DUF308 family)